MAASVGDEGDGDDSSGLREVGVTTPSLADLTSRAVWPATCPTDERTLNLAAGHQYDYDCVNRIGGPMKSTLLPLALSLVASPLAAQGAPPQGGANQPYTMEYYYKVQWGRQQEFLQLFLKNHYPLLQKEVETGRLVSVRIETPANHMTEEARWDYRVTLTFKNSTMATTSNPDEPALIKQLWPDQATFTREEQRRFEVLLSHWDLPVTDITPTKK